MYEWERYDHHDEDKRNHHNELEKQRRGNIKSSCEGLKAHLYFGKNANKKKSKATVLQAATHLISKSKQLINPLPKDVQRSVILKCDKFYKKLTRLADKIMVAHTTGDYDKNEMLKDYLTMKHMLRVLNRLPPQFLQLFAVEGVNKKAYFGPLMEDDSDAENEERLFQALGGDLKLDEESDDDGTALKPYFQNNLEAFHLIFKPDPHVIEVSDSDTDSEVDVENVNYVPQSRSTTSSGVGQRYNYRRSNKRKRSYSPGSGTSESEIQSSPPQNESPEYGDQSDTNHQPLTSDSEDADSSSDDSYDDQLSPVNKDSMRLPSAQIKMETYDHLRTINEDSMTFPPTQIKSEEPDDLFFSENGINITESLVSSFKIEPETPQFYSFPGLEAGPSQDRVTSPLFDAHFDAVLASTPLRIQEWVDYLSSSDSEFVSDPFLSSVGIFVEPISPSPAMLHVDPVSDDFLDCSFDVDQFLNPLPDKNAG